MSFQLYAVGRLAADPEFREAGKGVCTFALLSNDYVGANKPEVVTQEFFVAFGARARVLAAARVGDLLIVRAKHRANNHKQGGEIIYRYQNVVEYFEFGERGKQSRAWHALTSSAP